MKKNFEYEFYKEHSEQSENLQRSYSKDEAMYESYV